MRTATTTLPLANGRQVRAALRAALRPHRRRAVLTAVLLVTAAVVGLTVPWMVGRIVDLVLGHGDPSALTWASLALAGAALGQAVLNGAGAALIAEVAQSALASVRAEVVSRALTAPAQQVEESGTGDLVARATGDVEAVNEAASEVLPPLLEAGLTIVLTLVALTLLDWRFAVAAALAGPLQLVAVRWYARVVSPWPGRNAPRRAVGPSSSWTPSAAPPPCAPWASRTATRRPCASTPTSPGTSRSGS